MKLPASVKVGPLTYRIEHLARSEGSSRHLYGETLHAAQVIRVDLSHGRERAALCLLHELLHAAIDAYDVPLRKLDEEGLIRQLTAALGAAMRDSPEVFAFMLDGLASRPGEEG